MRYNKPDHGSYGKAHDYMKEHLGNIGEGHTKMRMPKDYAHENALQGEVPERNSNTGTEIRTKNALLGKTKR